MSSRSAIVVASNLMPLFLQHNLTEVYSWFRELADAHVAMVTLNTSIGRSHYGRNIMSVSITDRSVSEHKHKIYFQCLLHASKLIYTDSMH